MLWHCIFIMLLGILKPQMKYSYCYFEPMSLWYTNFTRNSGTVKVQGQLRPLFLILARSARRQYRTRYCIQYTVQRAHADGKERVRWQFGDGELNHGRVCATRARLHWTGFRARVQYARLRPRLTRKTYWTDSRTKHQTANSSSVWSAAQSVHQQTYVIQLIRIVESIRFDSSGGD